MSQSTLQRTGTPASSNNSGPNRPVVLGKMTPEFAQVLTPEALSFVSGLAHEFEPTRQKLLARRRDRQAEINAGKMPDFLPETRTIRESDWTVAPIPPDLRNRRVEI